MGSKRKASKILSRGNKDGPHEYKTDSPSELEFDTLRSFGAHPYSPKDSISSPVRDTACIRKVSSLESYSPFSHRGYPITCTGTTLGADPYTQRSEDDSFPNHLEPIDLFSFYSPNCLLYHGDPLEKTTNVADDSHPEHPFSVWSSSPDSVDSDLDDESLHSTSTSPLSFQHQSLAVLPEDDEDNDDMHFRDPSSSISHDIYPLEETKYPAHLYTPDQDAPLPLPPPVGQLTPPGWTYPPPFPPDPWGSPASLYDDYYSFTLHDPPTTIPSSPSRRTSRELPEDEEHAFESQRPVRLRSLPGAETDDDLIPTELASKNYIPDPSIVVSSTPYQDIDGLLLWDAPSRAKMRSDLPPARSPSPEEFTVDPNLFAELAGQEVGVEMQRIHELRERSSWDKDRFRELSALLRLKTQMLGNAPEHEGPSGPDDVRVDDEKMEDEGVVPPPPELEQSTSISNEVLPCTTCSSDPRGLLVPNPTVKDALDTTSTSTQVITKSPPKPKITNMAQLVANMVFHRQQEALRRSPPRVRTCAGPSSGNAMQGTSKTHPTPRSPLRQVSLPSDLENVDGDHEDEDDFSASLMELFESPLPLSPLVLTDSPLGWLSTP